MTELAQFSAEFAGIGDLLERQAARYRRAHGLGQGGSMTTELARELLASIQCTLALSPEAHGSLDRRLSDGQAVLLAKLEAARKRLALAAATVLAFGAGRFSLLEILLRPYVLAIKSVPVASFIILALIWLQTSQLSLFISFLMVFPVLYTNVLAGICSADRQLLEMARVFRVPLGRRLRGIYLPQVMPYFRTAVSLGLGLCWKAGAAAEIIGLPAGSMGERLYTAKVYFQTADLFAWTVTIVAVSVVFERLFLALVDRLMGKAGL